MKLFMWVFFFQPTHLELSAEKHSYAGALSRAKKEEARSNNVFGKTVYGFVLLSPEQNVIQFEIHVTVDSPITSK